MNSFYNRYNQYQLISGDEWIEGLIEHLQVRSSTFSSTTEEYEEDNGYFFEKFNKKYIWWFLFTALLNILLKIKY